MSIEKLKNDIGNIDIYLLSQILKGRYQLGDAILDAGCGKGRNLKWFIDNSFSIYGIDTNTSSINALREKYPEYADCFSIQNLDVLNFIDERFDHIICSAVLHFAQNKSHFLNMFSQLVRVLKSGGSLFVRMASIESIEEYVKPIANGVYLLPDNTNRFLLTDNLLREVMLTYNLSFLEPKKYVNVDNKRCMNTLVLQKKH